MQQTILATDIYILPRSGNLFEPQSYYMYLHQSVNINLVIHGIRSERYGKKPGYEMPLIYVFGVLRLGFWGCDKHFLYWGF